MVCLHLVQQKYFQIKPSTVTTMMTVVLLIQDQHTKKSLNGGGLFAMNTTSQVTLPTDLKDSFITIKRVTLKTDMQV